MIRPVSLARIPCQKISSISRKIMKWVRATAVNTPGLRRSSDSLAHGLPSRRDHARESSRLG